MPTQSAAQPKWRSCLYYNYVIIQVIIRWVFSHRILLVLPIISRVTFTACVLKYRRSNDALSEIHWHDLIQGLFKPKRTPKVRYRDIWKTLCTIHVECYVAGQRGFSVMLTLKCVLRWRRSSVLLEGMERRAASTSELKRTSYTSSAPWTPEHSSAQVSCTAPRLAYRFYYYISYFLLYR